MGGLTGGPGKNDRLESWKEIAAYLGREVRTVQLWEKSEGLPIHRHQHARQGSVYAFRAELDAWRAARKESPEPPAPAQQLSPGPTRNWKPLLAGIAIAAVAAGAIFWKSRASKPAAESLSSVVVLPFLDLSPQKDQEYF